MESHVLDLSRANKGVRFFDALYGLCNTHAQLFTALSTILEVLLSTHPSLQRRFGAQVGPMITSMLYAIREKNDDLSRVVHALMDDDGPESRMMSLIQKIAEENLFHIKMAVRNAREDLKKAKGETKLGDDDVSAELLSSAVDKAIETLELGECETQDGRFLRAPKPQ